MLIIDIKFIRVFMVVMMTRIMLIRIIGDIRVIMIIK
jgi:hypothetical protein